MLKTFQPKKGDQIGFTITFSDSVNFTSFELAGKKDYKDTSFAFYRTLGNGITKISDTTYQVTIPTTNLDYTTYVYDTRVIMNGLAYTPLSGKVIVKPTVFEAYNG